MDLSTQLTEGGVVVTGMQAVQTRLLESKEQRRVITELAYDPDIVVMVVERLGQKYLYADRTNIHIGSKPIFKDDDPDDEMIGFEVIDAVTASALRRAGKSPRYEEEQGGVYRAMIHFLEDLEDLKTSVAKSAAANKVSEVVERIMAAAEMRQPIRFIQVDGGIMTSPESGIEEAREGSLILRVGAATEVILSNDDPTPIPDGDGEIGRIDRSTIDTAVHRWY